MAASGRDRILLAAEQLIAERGVDVPFREIAAGAGQRNNSAVHYHFGSREGLIEAVLELRTAPQEERRLQLLAELEDQGRADDLPALVDTLVRPLCETPYAAGATHFARFVEQIRNHIALADTVFDVRRWPTSRIIAGRIAQALDHLPPDVRRRRLQSLMAVEFSLLAEHERRWDGTGSAAPAPEVVDDLVAMLVGLLQAPVLAVKD
jgi:AcrR family transcriptional regulator